VGQRTGKCTRSTEGVKVQYARLYRAGLIKRRAARNKSRQKVNRTVKPWLKRSRMAGVPGTLRSLREPHPEREKERGGEGFFLLRFLLSVLLARTSAISPALPARIDVPEEKRAPAFNCPALIVGS